MNKIHIHEGRQNNFLIFHMDEVDRRDNEKHDAFVILGGNIRGNMNSLHVLLLLSGTIKYIPSKQQRKTSHVEYNY